MSAHLIPLKAWVAEEAIRLGITMSAIYQRRLAGWYPGLSIVSVNKRVMFVERDDTPSRIRLIEWVRKQAILDGVTINAIYLRIKRGKYPGLALLRINKRVVLVDAEASFDWMGEGAGR